MELLRISKVATLQQDFTNAVLTAIEEGEVSPLEAWVYLNQLAKAIETVTNNDGLRQKVKDATAFEPQQFNIFEVRTSTGGAILDYQADHKVVELEYLLKERKALLDTAFKSREPIFDSEWVEIPKVPIKSYRKDSITVTKSKK